MATNLTPEQIAYLRQMLTQNGSSQNRMVSPGGDSGPSYDTSPTNFTIDGKTYNYDTNSGNWLAVTPKSNTAGMYDGSGNYLQDVTTKDDFMTKLGDYMPLILGAGLTAGIGSAGYTLAGAPGMAGSAGSGSSLVGNGMGAFAPEVGTSELVGNGLGAFAPTEAAGSNLVGNGMGAFAPGTEVTTVATEGGLLGSGAATKAATTAGSTAAKTAGLLGSGLTATDLGKIAAIGLGAAAGSKPTTTTSTAQSKTDPRIDPYIYGDDGILAQAKKWQQANQTGLNSQMLEGLNMQYNVNASPENMGAYQQMQRLGSGLMASPIAGNPFTSNGAKNLGFSNQNAGLLTPNASPYKQPTYMK